MKHGEAKRILTGAANRPVEIIWRDAHVTSDRWMERSEIDLDDEAVVQTCGVFVGLGKTQVWVSQAYLKATKAHSCPFGIPLGCVDSIRVLR